MTTTTLENATADDLLAFLRSDAPIPKRAAAMRNVAQRSAAPERRPLTPIESATLRRPPCAAERYRQRSRGDARTSGDYSQQQRTRDYAERLQRVECRAMAWLVCRALGDAWRFEVIGDDYRHNFHLVHRATTATLHFRRSWNNDERYEIVPENIHRTDKMPRSITVSAERCPADIARDIERRIVRAGLFDQNAAHLSAGHARRREEVARRRQILAVAVAYGGRFAPSHWSHDRHGQQRANSCQFGPADEENSHRRQTSICVESDYYGLKLEIGTANTELAIKIAELVRDYYN